MDELFTLQLPDTPVTLLRTEDGQLLLSTRHSGVILEADQVAQLHDATAPAR